MLARSNLSGGSMLKTVSLLVFAFSTSAIACPDFSGKYKKVFVASDDRKEVTWEIKQNGCDSYESWSQVFYKDGKSSDKVGPYTRIIDGTTNYWDGIKLFEFQKDVNTEHCDTRGFLEQDQSKNLRYSWRFECPQPIGTTPWFTPETTNGWTGELYLKQ